jgi:hypothetical protein
MKMDCFFENRNQLIIFNILCWDIKGFLLEKRKGEGEIMPFMPYLKCACPRSNKHFFLKTREDFLV